MINSKSNLLELFAGSRSVGLVGEQLGFNVFSSDINDFDGIDYVVDILNFDVNKVPFVPDVIWASPPPALFLVLLVLGTIGIKTTLLSLKMR